MATIRDVAALAAVSIKTVSRVLNKEPHVREELREKVLQAANALGYRPNQAARRMAGRRSYLIAYLYGDPGPAFVQGVQSGAAQYCRELGYHLIVEPVSGDREAIAEIVHRLVHTLAPDALFVAPPLSDNVDFLDVVSALNVRLIRLASQIDGPGINIATNDCHPAYEMTQHLIGLGHRRIGFICPPQHHLTASTRYEGFVQALTESGIEIDPGLVAQGDFSFEAGHETARAMLALPSPPTAIFAGNDTMALGAMLAAHELGISLPQGLSVAGFDDIPAARTCWPSLTTIRQPLNNFGIAAAAAAIHGEVPPDLCLDSVLIHRNSTCPPQT